MPPQNSQTARLLEEEPSCILKSSAGTPVHIVGVSHTSPYYADYAAKICSSTSPSVVCLEVCEDRLREQALRGTLAVEKRHTEIIQNAVRPFLEENGVWAIAANSHQLQQQHRLSNEGAAQLEGGFYGEEVTRSAIAATAAGAEIVAADRSKSLSKHRFSACAQQKLSERAESLNHDDITIVGQALCVAAENIASLAVQCATAATMSNATLFGNSVHPIFHAAASPQAAAALAACGCDIEALNTSLQHLMAAGSEPGAKISPQHLEIVRGCIRKVEQMRQQQHRETIRQVAATGCHARTPAPAAMDTAATLHGSHAYEPGMKSSTWSWIPATNELEAAESGKVSTGTLASDSGLRGVVSGVLSECARAANLPEWQAWGRKRAEAIEEAYMQTTVHERDCILAHRIRDVAESAVPGKPVVAVVGANHVPGIVAAWERAQTPTFQEQCADYLSVPNTQTRPPHAWKVKAVDVLANAFEGVAVVAGTGVAATAARRTLSHRAAFVGTAVVGTAMTLGVNSWWASYRRPARLVENLARYNDAAQPV